MKNRIVAIREHLSLSQSAFAEKIGLTRSFIWKVENGERALSERSIRDICKIYHVSYEWLTEGTGEMFENVPDSVINAIAATYSLDEQEKKMVLTFLELSHEERACILKFIKSLAE